MVENILDISGHDWTLDCAPRPIPLQNDPQATHATQKCRWSQQEDQRLRVSGEDCRKTAGSKQGIQFHVSKILRRTPYCAIQ